MTKNLRLLFFAGLLGCFLPVSSYAQGVFISPRTVFGTVNGVTRPIPNATVTVCAAGSAGIPCSPALAGTLFKDAALTQPLANPTQTDANGNYPTMAVAGGTYTLTESAAGFVGFSYQIVVACAPGVCAITSLTVTGAATVTGALTAQQANGVFWIGSGSGQYASLTACNAALPSTGGTCAMTEGFTDPTWTANLVVSKPNVTFLIPCSANIPMSTFSLTKAGGVNGFSIIQPCVPSIFGTGGHSVWQYSGTGSAFLLGDSTTTTWGLNLTNITMGVSNAAGTGINVINTPLFHITEPQIDFANPATAGAGIVLDGSGTAFTGSIIDGFRFYHKPFVGITFTGSGAGGFNANQVNVRGGSFVQGCATGGTGLNFVHGTGNHVETVDIEGCTVGVAFGNASDVANNEVSMWQATNGTDCTFGAASTHNTCKGLTGVSGTEPTVSGAGIALNTNQGNSAYQTADLALANGVLTKFGVDGATSYISNQLIGPSGGGVFTFLSNANSQFNLAYGAEPTTGDFSWYDGRFPSSGGTKRATLQRTTGIFTTYGSVATVGNGVPGIIAKADATAQQANIGTTLFYTIPANGGGMYRVSGYAVVTQAATTSSTLPSLAITATDSDTNASIGGPAFTLTSTGNTVGTTNSANVATAQNSGTMILNLKGGTTVSYSTVSYASSGATPMQYAVHVKLEYLGN